MEAFDDVRGLPGLAAAEQGGRKADRVKRNVVLAKELQVLHVWCLPPPISPISLRWESIGPLLGRGQVVDRRVEPDVENLALETRARHWHSPGEVACDAAIAQIRGQPASSQRCDPDWPSIAVIKPVAQPFD